MTVFLLECREDEERQADFPRKRVLHSFCKTTAGFTNGTILCIKEPIFFGMQLAQGL